MLDKASLYNSVDNNVTHENNKEFVLKLFLAHISVYSALDNLKPYIYNGGISYHNESIFRLLQNIRVYSEEIEELDKRYWHNDNVGNVCHNSDMRKV